MNNNAELEILINNQHLLREDISLNDTLNLAYKFNDHVFNETQNVISEYLKSDYASVPDWANNKMRELESQISALRDQKEELIRANDELTMKLYHSGEDSNVLILFALIDSQDAWEVRENIRANRIIQAIKDLRKMVEGTDSGGINKGQKPSLRAYKRAVEKYREDKIGL